MCAPGYAKSVRHVAGKVKARAYRAYGVADHDGYIIDHLIAVELDGRGKSHKHACRLISQFLIRLNPPGRPTHQRAARTAAILLTRGQVNAVRIAFKAG